MYKVTIEKIEIKKEEAQGEWMVLEKRPYTQKEVDEANNGFFNDDKEQELKSVYGYGDDKKVTKKYTTQVLEQTVDELNIKAVIQAINNL